MLSPLFGYNENELIIHGPMGEVSTRKETAPEYGLFLMHTRRNLVFTDFMFFTDVNNTDIFGNFAFLNWYADRKSPVCLNLGAGHLYHEISPRGEDITISVPMLKAGPYFSIFDHGITLNPYLGYSWEEIETSRTDSNSEYILYGLTMSWRKRMFGATAKYYYQDNRDGDEDYRTFRARAHIMATRKLGVTFRFDYMEHATSDDTSFLAGPVFVF